MDNGPGIRLTTGDLSSPALTGPWPGEGIGPTHPSIKTIFDPRGEDGDGPLPPKSLVASEPWTRDGGEGGNGPIGLTMVDSVLSQLRDNRMAKDSPGTITRPPVRPPNMTMGRNTW